MSWVERVVGAVRRGRVADPPAAGRMVRPRAEDRWRDYPSSGLTPSRLMSILREADQGSLSATMQLFAEMEEKDPHLYAVANTRRLAVTGLEWQVLSAADVRQGVDRSSADEAADYCRELLAGLESFDAVLQHLSLALGRNIAVAELVWENTAGELRLADICPVDFTRLVFDEAGRPRILTRGEPIDGVALPPNKFVVHTPHTISGHPAHGGLLRVTAMIYLAKNLALKNWLVFAEVFGMPVRVARYDPGASPEEKRELLRMLESLGSSAAGIFSRAVELQLIEATRAPGGPPYQALVQFLNREISKAWLGQTLTTETSEQSSSYAASRVHEEVRKDLRADDIRKEARTIRRDLLGPLCRLRFGPRAPVPYFTRRPGRAWELRQLGGVLDVAVNRLGVRVPAAWAHEVLGIPEPAADETVLPGRSD